jgi:hypothetical protein
MPSNHYQKQKKKNTILKNQKTKQKIPTEQKKRR